MYRTNTCGELTKQDVGKKVKIAGWVQVIRDLGGLLFIDLRDQYGITQSVVTVESGLIDMASKIPNESTISIEEGGTFPSDSRTLLTEHKPIMINSIQYWFLEESGIDYLYGSLTPSGAYPTITYFRVMKNSFTVEFHETAMDTVPTDSSDNFITSGGVYTALQNLPGGDTDLTPVNVGTKAATFPTEYMYVLQKHLPFTTGETIGSYAGTTWIYYTEDNSYYIYIQYLGYSISSSFNRPIVYRYAIINKSDKTWTQGTSSDISTVITSRTLPYNAFIGRTTPLSSNVNLNWDLNSGLYFCPNASSVVNSPTTNPFFIENQWVQYSTDVPPYDYTYIKQILTDFTTKDVYYRTFNSSTWSSWYKITATVVS